MALCRGAVDGGDNGVCSTLLGFRWLVRSLQFSPLLLRNPVLCSPSRRFDVEPRSKSSTTNAGVGGRTAREGPTIAQISENVSLSFFFSLSLSLSALFRQRAQSGQGAEKDIEATSFRGRDGSRRRRRRACSRHSSRPSFASSCLMER